MSEFLDMGGYAATVWPSYGAAVAILAGLLIASLRESARRRRELERHERDSGHDGEGPP